MIFEIIRLLTSLVIKIKLTFLIIYHFVKNNSLVYEFKFKLNKIKRYSSTIVHYFEFGVFTDFLNEIKFQGKLLVIEKSKKSLI